MPLSLSSHALAEKNKVASGEASLLLLEITYPGEDPVRVCGNNVITEWNEVLWYPARFTLGAIEESKDGAMPSASLAVDDIERRIQPEIEKFGGGIGAEARIRVVWSGNLADTVPEVDETFSIVGASVDSKNTITFDLGAENLYNYRSPQNRYLKNHCIWQFKQAGCLPETGDPSPEYTAAETCSGTFTQCRAFGNQRRYRGCPAIGKTGIFR